MTSLLRVFRATWLVPGLFVLIGSVAAIPVRGATPHDDYREGVQAAKKSDWKETARRMELAIANAPDETPTPVLIYGNWYEPYTPHFYLGLASANLGDCATALRELEISETQRVILETRRAEELRAAKLRCAETNRTAPGATQGETATTPAEDRHADHEELRAMMRTAIDALNSRNFDAFSSISASKVYITTVDGKTFESLAGFKTYLDDLYATKVEKIEFHPAADALTTFLGEDAGVCWGYSDDTYTFKGGETRTMKSRWTATLHKDGGTWKLVALHFSANILENPVVETAKGYAIKGVILASILALLIGFVAGRATKKV